MESRPHQDSAKRLLTFVSLILAVVGCGDSFVQEEVDGENDVAVGVGAADTGGYVDYTYAACRILAAANHASARELRSAGVNQTVIANLINRRHGDDGVPSTGDDFFFTRLSEVDDIPFVGPNAFRALARVSAATAPTCNFWDGGTPIRPSDGGTPIRPSDGGTPIRPSDAGTPIRPSDAGTPIRPRDAASLPGNKVDLLIMVDNSNSMAEEQATLARELPGLIRGLVTGDIDQDGVQDAPPVADIHIGIVTSDMGSFGYSVPTCNTLFGDDGVLRSRGVFAAEPSRFFSYGGEPIDEFTREVQAVAVAGTGGCGFEQPLEAVLKALTPSTSSVRFLGISETGPTLGNADRANEGFLREDSVLAVLLLTDEDDCSVADPELMRINGGPYNTDLNIRCSVFPEAQQPLARYAQGLRALRQSAPERFVFTAIVGVPSDLIPSDGRAIDYNRLLSNPLMQLRIDPATSAPNRQLLPSCNTPNGIAMPPIRIANLTRQLGSNASLHSICSDSYRGATVTLASKITDALR